MRVWLLGVGLAMAACAHTQRTCPSDTRLFSEDRATGRIEWCAKTAASAAMPIRGRAFDSVMAMAHPSAMSGGLHGPYTRWHPSGAVESHGNYIDDGSASIPDGVWGFWYADGSRRSVGSYERGRPVGCFSMWDEQGNHVTGIVEGDRLRIEPCEPPAATELVEIEKRSQPSGSRTRWGDASLRAMAQGGTFGVSNSTQHDPEPSAFGSIEAAVRRHVGRFRIGPALSWRHADSDDARAYAAAAIVGFELPLPYRRLGADIEAHLGVQYLDVTARRDDVFGVGSASFWSPLGGARLSVSVALSTSVLLTGGARIEGAPRREATREISYCAPFCTPPITEAWTLGGASYGVDLGLRLLLK